MKKSYVSILFVFISFVASTQVPMNGLVAHYPLDGSANDIVGNNHGMVHGASLVSDRFGNLSSAYQFHSTGYISASDSNLPLNANPRTISLCVFSPSAMPTQHITGNPAILVEYGRRNTRKSCNLVIWKNVMRFSNWSSPPDIDYSFNHPINIWFHVVVTLNYSSEVKLFINGELSYTSNVETWNTISSGNLYLGQAFPQGKLDDIRVYNRALSDLEVNSLYVEESKNNKNILSTLPSDYILPESVNHIDSINPTPIQKSANSSVPKQCKMYVPMKNEYANGIWTGEVKNGVVDGNGTFTSDVITFTGFTINGKINGYAEVVFANKTKLAGRFLDGIINGEGVIKPGNPIKVPLWNGEYEAHYLVTIFNNGVANGKLFNYDSNGKLIIVSNCINGQCSYTSEPPKYNEVKSLLLATGIILGTVYIYKNGVKGLSDFYSRYGRGLISCGLQYGIGDYIDDPVVGGVVTEAVGSMVESRNYSSKNAVISSAMNMASQKLQESGNIKAAKAISIYNFYDCLYENWFK